MIITGIGSRSTPAHILTEMKKIGKWARENGHFIRSGHADGADYAFEQGALENCLVYLPWNGYNSQLKILGRSTVPALTQEMESLVKATHPNVAALTQGAFKLHARNNCQVLGLGLNHPSNYVVCWHNGTGGTTQACRIATLKRVPVINMFSSKHDTAEKVIALLV